MRKVVLFLILAATVGAAAVWHFYRIPTDLSSTANDFEKTEEEVLGLIVLGGGDPVEKAIPEKQTPVKKEPSAAQPQEASSPPAGETIVIVQPGETLGHIALRNYGSSHPKYVDAIAKRNSLANPNKLKVGMKLTLPDPSTVGK